MKHDRIVPSEPARTDGTSTRGDGEGNTEGAEDILRALGDETKIGFRFQRRWRSANGLSRISRSTIISRNACG